MPTACIRKWTYLLSPSVTRLIFGPSNVSSSLLRRGFSLSSQDVLGTVKAKKKCRPPGGGRFLTDPSQVFDYNNWDNVEWDEEQEREARLKVDSNSKDKLTEEKQRDYEQNADQYWNTFYDQHQNRFFKDRHWLFTEFPELAPQISQSASNVPRDGTSHEEPTTTSGTEASFPGCSAKTRMLEVGCGVGNTVIPILQTNNDPGLFVYGCDLSSTAIQLLKDHADYDASRCHAFVCDVADPEAAVPFPDCSLDVIICIFVLSAIHPDKLPGVAKRFERLLKPGGLLVFRDYGRYDLTQLRFKTGRCLGDNLYVRGDGTKVYFFTQDELHALFVDTAGLVEQQNLIDRRLQVNRGRQIKMYRVWIQCKYRKPPVPAVGPGTASCTASAAAGTETVSSS